MGMHRETYAKVFIVALLTTGENWKQPNVYQVNTLLISCGIFHIYPMEAGSVCVYIYMLIY